MAQASGEVIITGQPQSITVAEGQNAMFTVKAYGAVSYTWYYRNSESDTWKTIGSKGTSATLQFTAAEKHSGHQYRCLIGNGSWFTVSDTATLTVTPMPFPVITKQPGSVTLNEGETVSFSVTASDAGSYQWYYRNSAADSWKSAGKNGTSAVYSFTGLKKHSGHQYRCEVKNAKGSVYSKTVSLSVVTKPVITGQPTSVTVDKGNTATFTVVADGAASYAWYYRLSASDTWKAISQNGSASSYMVSGLAKYSGRQYRCLVKNSAGSVYSDPATLTVACKPVITGQPADITVFTGAAAVFTVKAVGASGYQWYYRNASTDTWKEISSATASTYTFSAGNQHTGHQYRCLVRNAFGSVYTNAATLSVSFKPVITVQPGSLNVNEGKTATFKVTAAGASAYQWYYRTSSGDAWKAIGSNGSSTSYSVSGLKKYSGRQYRCLVKNSAGAVYSNTVTLTVVSKPVVTVQPRSVQISEGATAVFKITANGATAYQWYYRTSAAGVWKSVGSGGTSSSHSVKAKAQYSGYQYRCLVKNSAGSIYSNTVTLTVTVPVSNIQLNITAKTMQPDDKFTLVAYITPSTASKAVTWTSSNTNVATVKDGTVTAVSGGTAYITAKTADGTHSIVCTVEVVDNRPILLPNDDSLCLVCLGYQLNPNGSMQQELIGRLQVLQRVAEQYPNALIICTGGPTAASTSDTEAGQMASWLLNNGTGYGRILTETRSMSTQQNAAYTLAMLNQYYPKITHLALVTSDYHMSSALMYFQSEAARLGSGIIVTEGASLRTR